MTYDTLLDYTTSEIQQMVNKNVYDRIYAKFSGRTEIRKQSDEILELEIKRLDKYVMQNIKNLVNKAFGIKEPNILEVELSGYEKYKNRRNELLDDITKIINT